MPKNNKRKEMPKSTTFYFYFSSMVYLGLDPKCEILEWLFSPLTKRTRFR